jgi:hypothetical protein
METSIEIPSALDPHLHHDTQQPYNDLPSQRWKTIPGREEEDFSFYFHRINQKLDKIYKFKQQQMKNFKWNWI